MSPLLSACGQTPQEEALQTAKRLARTADLSDTEAIESLEHSQRLLDRLVEIQMSAAEWNLHVTRKLMDYYRRQEMWPKAVEQAEKLIQIQPTHARWYYLKGQIYGEWSQVDPEKVELAIDALRVALDLEPELYEAKYYLGLLKAFRQGEVARGRQHLEEVAYDLPLTAQNRPLVRRARFTLGKLEFEINNVSAARDIYHSILEMERLPRADKFRTHRLLSQVYRTMGAHQLAANQLRHAASIYPDDPRLQRQMKELGID